MYFCFCQKLLRLSHFLWVWNRGTMNINWTIDVFIFYSGSVFCFVCKDRAARQRNKLGPPACLGERCSSGRKLCHLLTSFFSPLSKNRILQRKGERGTARERQWGRRERRQMRVVFVLPCCEPESDLSSKIKTCRVQHLLDPLTHKHTYFLSFTRNTNIIRTARRRVFPSLQWKADGFSSTRRLLLISVPFHQLLHLALSTPPPSITRSLSSPLHPPILSFVSTYPSIHQLVQ